MVPDGPWVVPGGFLGGPGWSPDAARGLPCGFRAQNECLKKLRKSRFLAPGAKMGGF